MIECWRDNKYLYSDLEEMYLVNMQHNQDRDLLARELENSLGDNRKCFPAGVSCSSLVDLTIKYFNTDPTITRKLKYLFSQQHVKVMFHSYSGKTFQSLKTDKPMSDKE